jgi:hypothetical protein
MGPGRQGENINSNVHPARQCEREPVREIVVNFPSDEAGRYSPLGDTITETI